MAMSTGSARLITKRRRGASIAASGLVDRKPDHLWRVVDKSIVILLTADQAPSCPHQLGNFKWPKQELNTTSLSLHRLSLGIFALCYIMCLSPVSGQASVMTLQDAQRTFGDSASSHARGLHAENYSTWLLRLTWLISSGARRRKTTRKMFYKCMPCSFQAFYQTLDLDSRLGSCRTHVISDLFFKFIWKTNKIED
jgi:hypothetical protein